MDGSIKIRIINRVTKFGRSACSVTEQSKRRSVDKRYIMRFVELQKEIHENLEDELRTRQAKMTYDAV